MREAEARYRALVEQIPTVTYVCAFDSEGTILYISPQIEAIVGYPPSAWTEDPTLWQRMIHPEDRERVVAEVARCYEQNEQFRDEYRMVAADGRVVWFRDEETLLLDDDGEPRYTQGVLIDITREKRAERQLRLQHDLARVLAEAPTEEAALPKLLQVLGGDMDWAVGAIWVPGEGGLLRCHLLWHAPGVDAPEFDRLTRELSLARGMGLPGLAWERRRPVTGADDRRRAGHGPRRGRGARRPEGRTGDSRHERRGAAGRHRIIRDRAGRPPTTRFCKLSPRPAARSASSWCESAPRQSSPTVRSTIRSRASRTGDCSSTGWAGHSRAGPGRARSPCSSSISTGSS